MSELVNIIITTYDSGDGSRTGCFNDTVCALCDKLAYDNIHYIITDDSTPDIHETHLLFIRKYLYDHNIPHTILNTNRRGVGFAKNNALKLAFETSEIVLVTEDDWILQKPLNIYPHIKTLAEHSEVGIIRLGYLGGDMTAQYTSYNNVSYWKLLHKSGFYVYSGQISLRSKRGWYDKVGYHVEGVSAGKEEEELCHRYNDMKDAPIILWPADAGCTMNNSFFSNVGLGTSTNGVPPNVS